MRVENGRIYITVDGGGATLSTTRLLVSQYPNVLVVQSGGTVNYATDHGSETGLTDDDHPQYHNDARGDARYSSLGHDHDGVYTPVEHNHDLEYSVLGHDHDDDYADIAHNHDLQYSAIGHDHDDDYAETGAGNTFTGDQVFGTITDNVTINSLGIRLNGAATVFDDVKFDSLSLQQSGAGISLNLPECTVAYLASANQLDYMIAAPQMPHARKNGAVIYPHIHWEQNQNAVPNFALQYRYQLSLSEKTTAWTAVKCNIAVTTYGGTTKNMICKTAAGITPPATDDVSDIIQFRVIRDTTNALGLGFAADPYTGTVQVNSFDCHIEMDSFGSFDEYQK